MDVIDSSMETTPDQASLESSKSTRFVRQILQVTSSLLEIVMSCNRNNKEDKKGSVDTKEEANLDVLL